MSRFSRRGFLASILAMPVLTRVAPAVAPVVEPQDDVFRKGDVFTISSTRGLPINIVRYYQNAAGSYRMDVLWGYGTLDYAAGLVR